MNIRFLIFGVIGFAFVACSKDFTENTNVPLEKYFREYIKIDNNKEQFTLGDTLWFSADFNSELYDYKLGEDVSLENQTFILHGLVNLLKKQNDSILFINNNFEMLVQEGELKLVNVLNTTPESYSFDIRFGKPLVNNEVKFGIVLNYEAIFAIEFEALVFFGADRLDYDNFSLDNDKGFLNINFDSETINDSIFYGLPADYRYYYQNYFYDSDIASNKFYFIEVTNK